MDDERMSMTVWMLSKGDIRRWPSIGRTGEVWDLKSIPELNPEVQFE